MTDRPRTDALDAELSITDQRSGDVQRYRQALIEAERSFSKGNAIRETLKELLRHCDARPSGETAFERAVIAARAALSDALPDAPEGCTPTDARVLREANGKLAQQLVNDANMVLGVAKPVMDGNDGAKALSVLRFLYGFFDQRINPITISDEGDALPDASDAPNPNPAGQLAAEASAAQAGQAEAPGFSTEASGPVGLGPDVLARIDQEWEEFWAEPRKVTQAQVWAGMGHMVCEPGPGYLRMRAMDLAMAYEDMQASHAFAQGRCSESELQTEVETDLPVLARLGNALYQDFAESNDRRFYQHYTTILGVIDRLNILTQPDTPPATGVSP